MKKNLLLLLIFISIKTSAQQNTYTKVFYDSQLTGIEARSMVHTPDKGFMIVGQNDYNNGYLHRLDSAGNLLWNKNFAYNATVQFNSICNTYDSCFFIVGQAESNTVIPAVFCGKFNSAGDSLWMNKIDFNGQYVKAVSVIQTLDSGFLITGSVFYFTNPYQKIFVTKLNSSGNIEWSNLFNVAGAINNEGVTIKQGADSNYFLLGNFQDTMPNNQWGLTIIKLDQAGSFIWGKKYLDITSANDFVFTDSGLVVNFNKGNYNSLMKTDLDGNIIWSNSYCYTQGNMINFLTPKIKLAADSGFIVLSGSSYDAALTKIDSAGAIIWSDNLNVIPVDVLEIENKQIFVLGNGPMWGVKGIQILVPQIGVIVTDSVGNGQNCLSQNTFTPTPLTINSINSSIFTLSGGTISSIQTITNSLNIIDSPGCVDIYPGFEQYSKPPITISPNPSTGVFSIEINQNVASQLMVFDMLGNEMYSKTVFDDKTDLDLSGFSKGIYYCRIITKEKNTVTGSILIVQ